MRIICPNCEAQYEVEDRLVPETGRDVQCSNCGHAWFQYPVGAPGAEEEDEDEDAPQPTPAARVPLDESLRAVLREEAAREAAARAAEARPARRSFAPVAVQPDLGLDAAPGAPPAPPLPEAARRDPLPDVGAIKATLAGGAPPVAAAAAAAAAPPARGGFMRGFSAVIVIAALLYALYVFAPRMAAAVPALAGPLSAYTGAVDAAHRALAAALRGG